MKHCFLFFAVGILALTDPLFAQRFTQLWKIDAGANPRFPTTGDTYRGAAYNPVTDRYLVATRTPAASILVLNALTGALVDSLNVSIITGGTLPLVDVEVTSTGVIYATNLVLNTGSDTTFKIYRWENQAAVPTLAFSGRAGTVRIGDAFDVAGSGTGTVIYASGNLATSVIQTFRTTDGVTFTVGAPINILGQEAGAGIAQVTPGGNTYISRFAAGNKIDLVNPSATILDSVNSAASGASTGDIHYFTSGPKKYLAVAPAGSTNNDPARLLDITVSGTAATLIDSTGDLGNNANGNATGDVDVKIAGNIATLFVLVGNNGIAAYTINFTGTAVGDQHHPLRFDLAQNYPNPFNPITRIEFTIPSAGRTSLKVFDLLGQEIATLVNDDLSAGTHAATFDASNVASGVYFYRIESVAADRAPLMSVRRMVVWK